MLSLFIACLLDNYAIMAWSSVDSNETVRYLSTSFKSQRFSKFPPKSERSRVIADHSRKETFGRFSRLIESIVLGVFRLGQVLGRYYTRGTRMLTNFLRACYKIDFFGVDDFDMTRIVYNVKNFYLFLCNDGALSKLN
jgi:hypothetical protein